MRPSFPPLRLVEVARRWGIFMLDNLSQGGREGSSQKITVTVLRSTRCASANQVRKPLSPSKLSSWDVPFLIQRHQLCWRARTRHRHSKVHKSFTSLSQLKHSFRWRIGDEWFRDAFTFVGCQWFRDSYTAGMEGNCASRMYNAGLQRGTIINGFRHCQFQTHR